MTERGPRNWKTRRVAYSERVLALAHVGCEKLLDVIPLSEIISIQDCDGVGSADADDGAGRVMLEITLTVGFWHVLKQRDTVCLTIIRSRTEKQADCCPECLTRPEAKTPRARRKASRKSSKQLTPTIRATAV